MSGRSQELHARKAVSFRLMSSMVERLDRQSESIGWNKTKIIEYALATWLNQREMEDKTNGLRLAEIKR